MIPPSVDIEFVLDLLNNCSRIQATFPKGKTHVYVFKGNSSISNRTVMIRCVDDKGAQVDFDFAMAVAIKTKKQKEMMEWLLANRDYKG